MYRYIYVLNRHLFEYRRNIDDFRTTLRQYNAYTYNNNYLYHSYMLPGVPLFSSFVAHILTLNTHQHHGEKASDKTLQRWTMKNEKLT